MVIGAGNVAMDCARILAINPEELDPTDTASHALAAFHNSEIREVHIAARRGAEHAAFTRRKAQNNFLKVEAITSCELGQSAGLIGAALHGMI